ncbi:hypothetical protein [Candidatus Parabeggiatoa sp. HSG14]|uniref:hypothetical protein n=1 Tax=Candidatus Parabeggiatoa sp. HSG14 TaxID=3055593 RepID=UPI0025A6E62E|nr:hypothetical protein [Thiotrichales bacterium HSG14]
MKINYLLISRLTTNLTLFVFILFAAGIILWTSDEFLDWDILPNWIDNYAQLIIVIFGFFAVLLVLSSLLSSLAVLAEFAAKKMGVSAPPLQISRKRKVILLIVIVMVFVNFFIFHQIDKYREQARLAKNRVEFQEKLNKQSQELDRSLSQIITLFPDSILQAMHKKSLLEKQTGKELVKLLSAISASLPEIPQIALLMPAAHHPYKYHKIWITPEYDYRYYDESDEEIVLKGHDTHQQFFTQLPNVVEREVIEVLFKGKIKPLTQHLNGKFLNNSEPSSWGILKYQEKIVALIFLKEDIEGYRKVRKTIFHTGPKTLISN